MKKKLIAIAIAAAVAAPLAAQAAAEMSGDARVRYYTNDNSTNKGAQTDSRIGLDIMGTDGDVAMAKVRLEVENAVHGGIAEVINVDHAYISANVGAGVKVTGGKTLGNWGHKLALWDVAADRVDIQKSMGDMTFGLTFTKSTENGLLASANDDQDNSTTSLYFKMGKMGGIRADNTKNEAAATDAKRIDIYGGAPLGGGWGLGFEYASIDSTIAAGTATGVDADAGDKAVGLMIAAMGKVGDVDLTVGYASAADGFATDNDFFTFAGTGAQAGSMITGLGSTDGVKMSAMFVQANMKVSAVDVEAAVGMIKTDNAAGWNGYVANAGENVLSVKANYALSKNTSVTAQYGNFSGDMLDGSTMGASVQTKF